MSCFKAPESDALALSWKDLYNGEIWYKFIKGNILLFLSDFLKSFVTLWLQTFRESGKFATLSQRLDVFFAQFPFICIC